MIKKVAILANGGDVSGFNAVIRAIVKTADGEGEVCGVETLKEIVKVKFKDGEIYNYTEREYDNDYYTQPGNLFRLMPPEEQQLLFENTARAMGDAHLFIKQRHVRNCYLADKAYGEGVARALGIDLNAAIKS